MRSKIDRWTVTGTLILGTILFLTGALEDGHIDASDVRSAGVVLLIGCCAAARRRDRDRRPCVGAPELLNALAVLRSSVSRPESVDRPA